MVAAVIVFWLACVEHDVGNAVALSSLELVFRFLRTQRLVSLEPDFSQAILRCVVETHKNTFESSEVLFRSLLILPFAFVQKRTRNADFPNTDLATFWCQHAHRQFGLRRCVLSTDLRGRFRAARNRRGRAAGHLES